MLKPSKTAILSTLAAVTFLTFSSVKFPKIKIQRIVKMAVGEIVFGAHFFTKHNFLISLSRILAKNVNKLSHHQTHFFPNLPENCQNEFKLV